MTEHEEFLGRLRTIAATEGPEAALCELADSRAGSGEHASSLSLIEAQLLLDAGRYSDALVLARRLVESDPGEPESRSVLVDALELSGHHAEALAVVESSRPEANLTHRAGELRRLAAGEVAGREALREAAQRANVSAQLGGERPRGPGDMAGSGASAEQETASALEANPAEIRGSEGSGLLSGDALIRKLMFLFQGHPGAFAKQVMMKDGQFGYVPVRRRWDEDDLRAHLAGSQTLGVYLLDPAGSTRLACWDLDIRSALVERATADPELELRLKEQVRSEAHRFLELAGKHGLKVTVESSGRKGMHFWLFLKPLPAGDVRHLGNWMLRQLGAPSEGLSWEFFPKQDRPGPKGLGNLVKVPLGIHRATGRRSVFLEPRTLDPVPDQIRFVEGLARVTGVEVSKIFGGLVLQRAMEGSQPRRASRQEGGHPRRSSEARRWDELPELLCDLPEELETNLEDCQQDGPPPPKPWEIPLPDVFPPRTEALIAGCGVLRALVEQARERRVLPARERHVLLYTTAPLGEEGRLLAHQVLAQAPAPDPDAVNRELRAVGPTPIGCARIAQLLPGLATPKVCRCRFALGARGYPSPVIHAGLHPEAETKLPSTDIAPRSADLDTYLLDRLLTESDPARRGILNELLSDRILLVEQELLAATDALPISQNAGGRKLKLVWPPRRREGEGGGKGKPIS